MPKRYTRLEKREMAGLGSGGILDVVQDLHMHTTGACYLTTEERRRSIRILKTVLLTWDWSNFCLYDWLVHRLVVEALREAGQKIPLTVLERIPGRPG